jgi:predicted dehydrogenase
MRRRDFLKTTAVSGTAALSPNLIFAAGTPPSGRVNVALIGANNMGGKTHLPTIIGENRIQLQAICEADSEVLKKALDKANAGYAEKTKQAGYKGIAGLRDFRELLTRKDIDAVVIAVPDHWHIPMATQFVKAGKAVYVEKPLSLYIQEGREFADLVKQRKAIVQVGTQRRSQDQCIIACELVRNGVLGKIRHVDVTTETRSGDAKPWTGQPVPPELDYEMWSGPGPMSPYHPDRVHYKFRFVTAYSGGDVTNMGAHYIDVAQWGLGVDESGPVTVSGSGKRNPEGSIHDCYYDVDVDFTYANGTTLKFKTGKGGVVFHGEKGTLDTTKDLRSNPPELVRTNRDAFPLRFRKTPGNHMPNWIQCILDNKPENLHAPVEIGHRSASACHLVNLAMMAGRKLQWDPAAEKFVNDEEANKLLSRPRRQAWMG